MESGPSTQDPCEGVSLGSDIFISNMTENDVTVSMIIYLESKVEDSIVFQDDYEVGAIEYQDDYALMGESTRSIYRVFTEFLERDDEPDSRYIATAIWNDEEVSTEATFWNPAIETITVRTEDDDFSISKGHHDPPGSEARQQHEECYWDQS